MFSEIEETLNRIIDFATFEIDSDVIDKLVVKIIPVQKDKFKWILNLTGENNHLYTSVSGRKGKAEFDSNLQKDLPLFLDCSGSYQGLIPNKTTKSVDRKGNRFFVLRYKSLAGFAIFPVGKRYVFYTRYVCFATRKYHSDEGGISLI